MKKIIIFLFIFIVITVGINESKNILIPDNAIRFRVIANSDLEQDQKLKLEIKTNLNQVDNIIKPYGINYDISYGNNYFPSKVYKGITYDAGNYESLVITLGSGKGHNWWCVLFPPLCLLDEQEDLSNAKYELYASKLINKFK